HRGVRPPRRRPPDARSRAARGVHDRVPARAARRARVPPLGVHRARARPPPLRKDARSSRMGGPRHRTHHRRRPAPSGDGPRTRAAGSTRSPRVHPRRASRSRPALPRERGAVPLRRPRGSRACAMSRGALVFAIVLAASSLASAREPGRSTFWEDATYGTGPRARSLARRAKLRLEVSRESPPLLRAEWVRAAHRELNRAAILAP